MNNFLSRLTLGMFGFFVLFMVATMIVLVFTYMISFIAFISPFLLSVGAVVFILMGVSALVVKVMEYLDKREREKE